MNCQQQVSGKWPLHRAAAVFWTWRAEWVEGRVGGSCEGCGGRNCVASAQLCDREHILYRSIARMWEGLQRGKEGGDVEREK